MPVILDSSSGLPLGAIGAGRSDEFDDLIKSSSAATALYRRDSPSHNTSGGKNRRGDTAIRMSLVQQAIHLVTEDEKTAEEDPFTAVAPATNTTDDASTSKSKKKTRMVPSTKRDKVQYKKKKDDSESSTHTATTDAMTESSGEMSSGGLSLSGAMPAWKQRRLQQAAAGNIVADAMESKTTASTATAATTSTATSASPRRPKLKMEVGGRKATITPTSVAPNQQHQTMIQTPIGGGLAKHLSTNNDHDANKTKKSKSSGSSVASRKTAAEIVAERRKQPLTRIAMDDQGNSSSIPSMFHYALETSKALSTSSTPKTRRAFKGTIKSPTPSASSEVESKPRTPTTASSSSSSVSSRRSSSKERSSTRSSRSSTPPTKSKDETSSSKSRTSRTKEHSSRTRSSSKERSPSTVSSSKSPRKESSSSKERTSSRPSSSKDRRSRSSKDRDVSEIVGSPTPMAAEIPTLAPLMEEVSHHSLVASKNAPPKVSTATSEEKVERTKVSEEPEITDKASASPSSRSTRSKERRSKGSSRSSSKDRGASKAEDENPTSRSSTWWNLEPEKDDEENQADDLEASSHLQVAPSQQQRRSSAWELREKSKQESRRSSTRTSTSSTIPSSLPDNTEMTNSSNHSRASVVSAMSTASSVRGTARRRYGRSLGGDDASLPPAFRTIASTTKRLSGSSSTTPKPYHNKTTMEIKSPRPNNTESTTGFLSPGMKKKSSQERNRLARESNARRGSIRETLSAALDGNESQSSIFQAPKLEQRDGKVRLVVELGDLPPAFRHLAAAKQRSSC